MKEEKLQAGGDVVRIKLDSALDRRLAPLGWPQCTKATPFPGQLHQRFAENQLIGSGVGCQLHTAFTRSDGGLKFARSVARQRQGTVGPGVLGFRVDG